jgi:hypothetical protein
MESCINFNFMESAQQGDAPETRIYHLATPCSVATLLPPRLGQTADPGPGDLGRWAEIIPMNKILNDFKIHCGDNYNKFVESLYANTDGIIELKFWQQKLIDSFYDQYVDGKVSKLQLLDLIRDGREMTYKCKIKGCDGIICCADRKSDLWGCGEC